MQVSKEVHSSSVAYTEAGVFEFCRSIRVTSFALSWFVSGFQQIVSNFKITERKG